MNDDDDGDDDDGGDDGDVDDGTWALPAENALLF